METVIVIQGNETDFGNEYEEVVDEGFERAMGWFGNGKMRESSLEKTFDVDQVRSFVISFHSIGHSHI